MLATTTELKEILQAWGLDPECEALRSSWHNVFRARKNGKNYYLRLTPSIRQPDEILAEVEWMQSLAVAGVSVAKILPLCSGQIMETRSLLAGPVSLCCFEEAPGRATEKRLDFRPPVIENWARLLAKLHDHARSFVPRNPTARRKNWDQDSVFRVAQQEARQSAEPEAALFLDLIEHFQKHAAQKSLFLTHTDLHFGNMTITEENDQLCAFDFDDACYHFPEHDVAVALISIRKGAWENPGLFDAPTLEKLFVETYARPIVDLGLWCAYRLGMTYFWALGSAKEGVFDEERLAWLKKSTPWWKDQFRKLLS